MSTNPPLPPGSTAPLFCSHCGAAVNPGDPFCSKCAAPQPGAYVAPAAVVARPQYAGFWIRFAAWLVDAIIIGVVFSPIQFAIFSAMGVSAALGSAQDDPEKLLGVMMPAFALTSLLSVALQWLYEALMTSSSKQATVGKMACGLRVTDLHGQRLTFARATGRYFAKILSGMTLLIGYIMAGFTERKQALHDFVAGTYVLKG